MSPPPPRTRVAPRLAGATLGEIADLCSAALRAQARQWQRAVEKLGAGRYGPAAAVVDLGETAERALMLSAELVSLCSRSLFFPGSDAAPVRERPRDPGPGPPPPPSDLEPEPEAPSGTGTALPPARKASARHTAERFLIEHLGPGEKHSRELMRLARAQGISESTLQRAKRRIGVRSRREGFGPESRVYWRLPSGHR